MRNLAIGALVIPFGAWISAPSAGQEEKRVKAVVYEVYVYDSALDMTHRADHWIREVYVPEHGIAFNTAKGLNVFKTDEKRYVRLKQDHVFGSLPPKKVREIEIAQKELDTFLEILRLQEKGRVLATGYLEGR